MSADNIQVTDAARALLAGGGGAGENFRVFGTYHAVCRDKDGNIKWEAEAPNLVTDAGAKLLLDTILAGSAFTATCYMGLKGSGTAVVGDTQASHAGWSEQGLANAPAYTGSRKTVTFSAASGTGAGSRTKASTGTYTYAFTSGSNLTVDGVFLNINGSATVDNTTGTLFSVGTFSGGAQTGVDSGDSLTVTYQLSC